MKLSDLVEIGRIKGPHGLNGQLKVKFDTYYTKYIMGLSALIIEKGEEYLPFFIEKIDDQIDPKLIHFESIKTKEEASLFVGKSIYAIVSELPAVKENQLELLEGLTVFDERDFAIGVIQEVLELPSQLILRIEGEGKEMLVPFHEDFVIELSPEKGRLQMQIPEGLLDIYS